MDHICVVVPSLALLRASTGRQIYISNFLLVHHECSSANLNRPGNLPVGAFDIRMQSSILIADAVKLCARYLLLLEAVSVQHVPAAKYEL